MNNDTEIVNSIEKAQVELTMDEWFRMCYERPDVFAHYYFPHILRTKSSKFHSLLYSIIRKLNNTEYSNNIAIAAPRGNAKTQVMCLILPIWCIVFEQKKFMIILSETSRHAESNLEAIKFELTENERLLDHFPHICGEGAVWRKEEICTNSGVVIIALGSGKQVRGSSKKGGMRPGLLILDDCESDQLVRTKNRRDQHEEWFTKSVMGMAGPAAQDKMDVVLVGTIIHPHSLLSKLLDVRTYPGWEAHKFKAVYKFSKSPLWRDWERLYINHEDENRKLTAKLFFEKNKEEMLEGTEVLWPEGDPYYSLMEYKINNGPRSFFCFTPETKIVMDTGYYKPIKDIVVGDKVITHDGSIQRVSCTNIRETNSDIYSIKIAGSSDMVNATEEHPFLVWNKVQYSCYSLSHEHLNMDLAGFKTNRRKNEVKKRIENNKLVWKFTKDLKIGDAVVFPIPKVEVKKHKCDADWWWLVGYYLAEGSINYSNNTIQFHAHIDEIPYLEETSRICNKFNYGKTHTINTKHSHSDKVASLILSSKELIEVLKPFGRYSHGKFLPKYVDYICKNCFKALWDGYICGDGYAIRIYKGVNSASEQLLLGFQKNWLKFGYISYMYQMRKGRSKGSIRGREFNQGPLWSLQKIKSKRALQAWIHGDYLYSRIQRIERLPNNIGPTKVHGITVNTNHTYCVPNAVVKNSEKQNNPVDPSQTLFDISKVQYFDIKDVNIDKLDIYGAVDPASGNAKVGGDLSAVITVGRDKKSGIIYVLDEMAKEAPPSECIKYIKEMHRLYGYSKFGVDSDALKLFSDYLKKDIPDLKVILYDLRLAKAKRIERLEPVVHSGLVRFQKNQYELITELEFYPKSEYDDGLDALEIAVRLAGSRGYRLLTY